MQAPIIDQAFGLVLAAVALLPPSPLARPDTTLTPGHTRPLSKTQICQTAWGYDRRHVTARMRLTVATSYGLTVTAMSACCELDHLILRSMGGADDVRNLWPQPWPEARQKDRLEVFMDKAVCAGRVSLREAQEMFRTDWRAGYDRHMPPRPSR